MVLLNKKDRMKIFAVAVIQVLFGLLDLFFLDEFFWLVDIIGLDFVFTINEFIDTVILYFNLFL